MVPPHVKAFNTLKVISFEPPGPMLSLICVPLLRAITAKPQNSPPLSLLAN